MALKGTVKTHLLNSSAGAVTVANDPENDPIMRPALAALYLTISQSRLAKLRVTGGGPAYFKAGRSVLYRRSHLEAWLASRCVKSTSDTTSALAS